MEVRGAGLDYIIGIRKAGETMTRSDNAGPLPVAVVVVSWNCSDYLADCLTSLRELDRPVREIVVVDNASTDGSAEIVREGFPEVRLIEAGDNLGFCRANNLGIAATRDPVRAGAQPGHATRPGFLAGCFRRSTTRGSGSPPASCCASTSATLDSCGQMLARSRQPVDRGYGEADRGQYDATTRSSAPAARPRCTDGRCSSRSPTRARPTSTRRSSRSTRTSILPGAPGGPGGRRSIATAPWATTPAAGRRPAPRTADPPRGDARPQPGDPLPHRQESLPDHPAQRHGGRPTCETSRSSGGATSQRLCCCWLPVPGCWCACGVTGHSSPHALETRDWTPRFSGTKLTVGSSGPRAGGMDQIAE